MSFSEIQSLLGNQAATFLEHHSRKIGQAQINRPSPNMVEEIFLSTGRNNKVLRNIATLYSHGRLGGTGYLSILPTDHSIGETAGSAFVDHPAYFDPEQLARLAIVGGCSAISTSFGTLSLLSRKYAHKIPFIVKLSHQQLLSFPQEQGRASFGSVREAWNLGAIGITASVEFGSTICERQLTETAHQFEMAHELGMFCVLNCHVSNDAFCKYEKDYCMASDITAQANHIGVALQADFIIQRMPTIDKGFQTVGFGATDPRIDSQLLGEHPIDRCRYQLANCFNGKIPLLHSGGESLGDKDLTESVKDAIVNKRAGGSGMMIGRKAIHRPFAEGVRFLQTVQDVYLSTEIGLA